MPVNTPHAEYAAHECEWLLVRDCIAGQRRIKANAKTYVPMLTGQSEPDYTKMIQRGVFFSATDRTQQAMLGLLFRKPPNMDGIDKIDEIKEVISDADMHGNTFVSYARRVMGDVCAVGRAGTLVDYSTTEARPYCAFYCAESIINWRVARINGRMVLDLLVLEESIARTVTDEFAPAITTSWRVLRHNGGAVTFEIWELKDGENGKSAVPTLTTPATAMLRKGAAVPFIPFVFHGAHDNGPCVNDVTLADVACVNVSHFGTSVDLEHGRHLTGLPTPWAAGYEVPKGGMLEIGSGTAWVTKDPNAKCGYLEFTGQGLTALTDAIKEKQEQMAALGARLIEPKQKDAESFDTVALRASAESSTMARIGQCGTESLTMVLALCRWWNSTLPDLTAAAEKIIFQINKDFVSSAMTDTLLTALVSAWQQGAISQDTLFYCLAKGEMYAEGVTIEVERAALEAHPAMPPALPAPAPTPGGAGA